MKKPVPAIRIVSAKGTMGAASAMETARKTRSSGGELTLFTCEIVR